MLPLVARLASLLLGVGLALVGVGLLGTLLAVRLAQTDMSPASVGGVLSAYFAGLMAGALAAHRTIARTGHIRAFAAFAAAVAVAALAHGLTPPSWLWAILRALTGFCMAGIYMTVESWLHASSSDRQRGKILAAYMVTIYLGLGAGQLLLNVWPLERIEPFCLAAMAMSLALIPVSLTRTAGPALHAPARLPLRALVGHAPLGVAASTASGIVTATIYAMAPVYGTDVGLDARGVSFLMSSLIFGGLLLQGPLGWLSDRGDRRAVLLGVCLALAAVGALLSFHSGAAGPSLYALAALFGGLAFSLYPIGVAHVLDRLAHELVLPASSLMLLTFAAGSTLGPLAASTAMVGLGAQGLFAFDAAIAAGLAVLALLRIRRVAPVPEEEKATFRAVPGTTPVAGELDPRAESVDDPTSGAPPAGRLASSPRAGH